MLKFYGIDLGTTHTLVVEAHKVNNQWEFTKLRLDNMPIRSSDNITKTELLPSVVYFGSDGKVVAGEYAKEWIHIEPDRVQMNSKIDLGARLQHKVNNRHSPQEVAKELLKVCFAKIVENGGENAKVRISVPAAFSQDKRKDVQDAANNALFELGYNNIKLITTTEEPYAALLNLVVNEKKYIDMIQKDNNTIMLIDIGGGTMDIIIADISFNATSNQLSASTKYEPAKHDEFAGARFDYELMQKFMIDLLNHYELNDCDIAEYNKIILEKRMLMIAEDAKKFLCDSNNLKRIYEYTFDHKGLIDTKSKGDFKISLSKTQMDNALQKLLFNTPRLSYSYPGKPSDKSIAEIIESTLSENDLKANEIDCIYLTGGMANYDQITKAINSVIPKPVIKAEEPLFCTAMGVALSLVFHDQMGKTNVKKLMKAPLVNNTDHIFDDKIEGDISVSKHDNYDLDKDLQTIDVCVSETNTMGMSYFIDVENMMPVEIINKSQEYPCLLKKLSVQLQTSSQSRMSLILYEGHSIYDCNMKLLKKKIVDFNEIVAVGTPIDISYKIDTNKIITIYASIDGNEPYQLNTEEV